MQNILHKNENLVEAAGPLQVIDISSVTVTN